MLFMLLQLSKQYTVCTNSFIKIHLVNQHPQQEIILCYCFHGYDIEFCDRWLPEFEMNICPLFLVVDVPTVHHIMVTFTARDPLHYGPYTVHVCVQQYTIKPYYYNKPWKILINLIHKRVRPMPSQLIFKLPSWYSIKITNLIFILIFLMQLPV
jgi:hypothetical protein